MNWLYDDGGRAAAGYKGKADDCATRAIAIAAQLPYQTVYDWLTEARKVWTGLERGTARDGMHPKASREYLTVLGWTWTPTMGIGTGCKVHLMDGELPMGRVVARLSRHLTAVIDGVIHDTYDPSRNGTRCVYGFWTAP